MIFIMVICQARFAVVGCLDGGLRGRGGINAVGYEERRERKGREGGG